MTCEFSEMLWERDFDGFREAHEIEGEVQVKLL